MDNDDRRTIAQSEDLKNIRAIAGGAIGEECWNAGLSYGDELYLDLGERRQYKSGPMAGKDYGEWQFFARATPWTLVSGTGQMMLSDSDEPTAIKAGIRTIVGARVSSLDFDPLTLGVQWSFDNGHLLKLLKCEDAAVEVTDEIKLACWELITPESKTLQVFSGSHWSYELYERS